MGASTSSVKPETIFAKMFLETATCFNNVWLEICTDLLSQARSFYSKTGRYTCAGETKIILADRCA